MDGLDLAPFHFSEIKKESIAWRPCPARVQGRGSQQDKARILSSVRAEADLWGADGPAYTASLCGREAIFHRISDPRRSCLRTTALLPGRKRRHLQSEGGKMDLTYSPLNLPLRLPTNSSILLFLTQHRNRYRLPMGDSLRAWLIF